MWLYAVSWLLRLHILYFFTLIPVIQISTVVECIWQSALYAGTRIGWCLQDPGSISRVLPKQEDRQMSSANNVRHWHESDDAKKRQRDSYKQWRIYNFKKGAIQILPPLPLHFSLSHPHHLIPLISGPLNFARGSEERCKLLHSGIWVDLWPKSNLMHFALKSDIW